jgi:hypothetical protein
MRYVKDGIVHTITNVRAQNPGMSIREGADLSDLGYAPLIEALMPPADAGFRVIEGTPTGNTQTWLQKPLDIEIVRSQVLRKINEAYEAECLSGITFNGFIFDSDALSINRISGAVTLVLAARSAGGDFETDWILKDNTTIHLTGNDIIGLGKAAAIQQQTAIFTARTKKDLVEGATTVAVLLTISI